jgi:hypothetical protein
LRAAPRAAVEVELVAPRAGRYSIHVGWLTESAVAPRQAGALRVELAGQRVDLVHHTAGCEDTIAGTFMLGRRERVRFETADDVILDYLELTAPNSK